MPIYEYRCQVCGHVFERMGKMSDPNPTCPHLPHLPQEIKTVGSDEVTDRLKGKCCGGETEKLISRGSFQLKGGGWYKDGY